MNLPLVRNSPFLFFLSFFCIHTCTEFRNAVTVARWAGLFFPSKRARHVRSFVRCLLDCERLCSY